MSISLPDRIYAQYRTKPNAVKWYQITRALADELGNPIDAVRVMYNIDTAVGAQLDIIGRIVVVDRKFVGQISLDPGLFASAANGPDEFGDTEAVFASLFVDQDNQMSDEFYRMVIKSKIIKNNSDATIESILRGVNFLLPKAEVLRVTDNENMSFSVEFYGDVTEIERYVLLNSTLVPKPQGVRFGGFLEAKGYVQFNDEDYEFGDTNAEFVGLIGGD